MAERALIVVSPFWGVRKVTVHCRSLDIGILPGFVLLVLHLSKGAVGMITPLTWVAILDVWEHPKHIPSEHGVYVFRRLKNNLWKVILVGSSYRDDSVERLRSRVRTQIEKMMTTYTDDELELTQVCWLTELANVVEVEYALRGEFAPPGNRQEMPVNRKRWEKTRKACLPIIAQVQSLLLQKQPPLL